MVRYVFVTGGVVSSLGKGIAAASLGRLLKERGLVVTMQKFDPYINVDPGTMNPFQHGEVFVTNDGAETDLDLGHYERFLDTDLTRASSVSAGQIYHEVIQRERRGDYLGATIQVIPHITDEIKSRITGLGRSTGADIVICEIGGTVGDIESLPFLEAIRQLRLELGRERTLFIHLTLVPYINAAHELKTKPTQHSVRSLLEIGIQPDILVCRTEKPLSAGIREKIALFTNVSRESVIEARDVTSIYEVPLVLHRGGLDRLVADAFSLDGPDPDLASWRDLVDRALHPQGSVKIALCGKYTHLVDAYKSVVEALRHAGIENNLGVEIVWVESEQLEDPERRRVLETVDGILVPGGFGGRGIEGKVRAIQYARENSVPFLGLCLGMQCAVIEFARNVCGLDAANSSEFDPETAHPVIHLLPEQRGVVGMGATMRLGSQPCRLAEGSRARDIYRATEIAERHRHRYEFNNDFAAMFESKGMNLSGREPAKNLVEIVEIPAHPWFVACQFHPELASRPNRAHPLFREFVRAAAARSRPEPNGRDARDASVREPERASAIVSQES
ncbi:MAG: CTP synthase [bacterium]